MHAQEYSSHVEDLFSELRTDISDTRRVDVFNELAYQFRFYEDNKRGHLESFSLKCLVHISGRRRNLDYNPIVSVHYEIDMSGNTELNTITLGY